MDMEQEYQQLALLLGAIMPFIISFVKGMMKKYFDQEMSSEQIRMVTVAACILGVVMNRLLVEDFSGDLLKEVVIVIGATQAVYALVLKPTNMDERIEKI